MDESKPTGSCHCGCGEPTAPGACFRHGHWARTRPLIDLAATFWGKVDKRGPDDCWPWGAYCRTDGYGMVWDPKRKRMVNAHIVAYELTRGPLPPRPKGALGATGVLVRHTCDNPPCCNPAHLRSGSHGDNMRDKVERGRQPDHHGERNPKAKLTAAEVAQIRASYTGRYGEKMAIARCYGISSGHVSKIIAGHSW